MYKDKLIKIMFNFFQSLLNHFKTIPVNEKEALTFFIYTIKTNGNKLDQKTSNNNSDTI